MGLVERIQKHALDSFPEEAVGYIDLTGYHKLPNVSNLPRESYSLSLDDRFLVSDLHDRAELVALVHSHTRLDSSPSEKDMEAHSATGYDFYIIGTDGKTTTKIRRILWSKQ